MVHHCRPFQLAKHFEKLFLVFEFDALATIDDVGLEETSFAVIAHIDANETFYSELECVFDLVDQHLLQT